MRFVVYGAGAVGGVLGGRLHEAGHEVVLIARGAHLAAIQADGLRIESRLGEVTLPADAVGDPREIDFRTDDVVFLCMKGQHTEDAVRTLAAAAPGATIGVVSAQNGVANEPISLRYFANVYGMCVMRPVVHLEPGIVEASSAPVSGILDIGRYPHGVDARAEAVSEAVTTATFHSVPRPDIMRWKYGKLMNNLSNALDALCGPGARGNELDKEAREEARARLDAAGIPFVDREEDQARRGDVIRWEPGGGKSRPGASSWQSLARGTGSIEADYLNGEIVMLGRLHGIATPVNAALQRLANQAAREQWAAGSVSPDDMIRLVRGSEEKET